MAREKGWRKNIKRSYAQRYRIMEVCGLFGGFRLTLCDLRLKNSLQ